MDEKLSSEAIFKKISLGLAEKYLECTYENKDLEKKTDVCEQYNAALSKFSNYYFQIKIINKVRELNKKNKM